MGADMKSRTVPAILLILSFFLPASARCETVDVLIKGVYSGAKTDRQTAYALALMNAKLQAIERAGTEVASLTQVENFTLKYDLVESRARAVVLPGFQVLDIGYQLDGTYLVVLAGKVRVGEEKGKLWAKLRPGPLQFPSFRAGLRGLAGHLSRERRESVREQRKRHGHGSQDRAHVALLLRDGREAGRGGRARGEAQPHPLCGLCRLADADPPGALLPCGEHAGEGDGQRPEKLPRAGLRHPALLLVPLGAPTARRRGRSWLMWASRRVASPSPGSTTRRTASVWPA